MNDPVKSNWKYRLYDAYVSSKQAGGGVETTTENPFRSNAPYIKKLISDHIPADQTLEIVDLGCGHGVYVYFLKKAGYKNVSGVDISQEQVELAHSLGIQEVVQGEID